MQALKPGLAVQSYTAQQNNGYMPLIVSTAGGRTYLQLHPEESLFISSKTVTIAHGQDLDIQVASSGLEAGSDAPAQEIRDESQLQSSVVNSPKVPETPAKHTHGHPVLISPPQATVLKDLESKSTEFDTHEIDLAARDDPLACKITDTFADDSGKGTPSSSPSPSTKGTDKEKAHSTEPIDLSESETGVSREQSGPRGSEKRRPELDVEVVTSTSKRQKTDSLGIVHTAETQDSIRSTIHVQTTADLQIDDGEELEEPRAMTPDPPSQRPATQQSEDLESRPGTEEPSSSTRSTRSAPQGSSEAKWSIRILFAGSSSIETSKKHTDFLSFKGVKRVTSIEACTHLCVSKSVGLVKTSKVILAVLQGKEIISDDWISKSMNQGSLLNIESFVVRDRRREAEWGMSLDEAIHRGQQERQQPFSDWTVIFSPTAKEQVGNVGLADLKKVIHTAGGKVSTAMPKHGPGEDSKTLIIAVQDDLGLESLIGRWRCFSRDIISLSALRGKLDTDSDEFLVTGGSPTAAPKRGRKPKK